MAKVIPISIDKTRAVIHTADSFGGISVVIWFLVSDGTIGIPEIRSA